MVNANELRIGNWVQAPLGEFMQVQIIGHEDNPDYVFARNKEGFGQNAFSPIPLTEDILVKAGFEKSKDDGKLFLFGVLSYSMIYNTVSIFQEQDDFSFSIGIADSIKHLHQLQNLYFALTQTELTINL